MFIESTCEFCRNSTLCVVVVNDGKTDAVCKSCVDYLYDAVYREENEEATQPNVVEEWSEWMERIPIHILYRVDEYRLCHAHVKDVKMRINGLGDKINIDHCVNHTTGVVDAAKLLVVISEKRVEHVDDVRIFYERLKPTIVEEV